MLKKERIYYNQTAFDKNAKLKDIYMKWSVIEVQEIMHAVRMIWCL